MEAPSSYRILLMICLILKLQEAMLEDYEGGGSSRLRAMAQGTSGGTGGGGGAAQLPVSSVIKYFETPYFSLGCNKSERIPGIMTTTFLSNPPATFGCLVSADRSGYFIVVSGTSMPNTPIWVANRQHPVRENASLVLDPTRRHLILRDSDGSRLWGFDNASDAAGFALTPDGNLILFDRRNLTLWESFSEPIDLIVPGQILEPNTMLQAGFSSHISLTANFVAVMKPGGLVFYENSTSQPLPYCAFAYPWTPTTLEAVLDSPCNHTHLNLTEFNLTETQVPLTPPCAIDPQSHPPVEFEGPVSFIRLDPDGVLRGYYPDHKPSYDLFKNISHGSCGIPNACGPYAICSTSSLGPSCKCPGTNSTLPPFNVISNSTKFLLTSNKCTLNISLECQPASEHRFFEVKGVDYFANDHIVPTLHNTSFANCQEACARNCSCKAAFYRTNSKDCFLHEEVMSMISVVDLSYVAAVKLQALVRTEKRNSEFKLIVGITVATTISVLIFAVWFYRKEKKGLHRFAFNKDEDDLLASLPGQPRRFSFKELQAATWEFSQKLGVGGFGSVYRGIFPDGSSVAVKQLENITTSSQGLKEFRNEVITLSNINHQNLVHLRGFCAEGAHRLLVYEFVSNGSLDTWLFQKGSSRPGSHLDWKTRLSIAAHTARGLYFLHEQCRNSIIHLDIKPQNILLDENFVAKIADFGLSRLVNEDHNTAFTRMRGTPGYMAPECLIITNASEKSDVYSFGMVLLEIVSGRKNVDVSRLVLHGDDESWYFPAFASQKFKEGQVDEILDMNLGSLSEIELAEATRVIQIAFWCIQDQPSLRPSMCKVLHMLEGFSEVRTPPLSFSFGMRFHLNNTIASAPQTPQNNGATRAMDSPNGDHQNTASPGRDVSPRRSPIGGLSRMPSPVSSPQQGISQMDLHKSPQRQGTSHMDLHKSPQRQSPVSSQQASPHQVSLSSSRYPSPLSRNSPSPMSTPPRTRPTISSHQSLPANPSTDSWHASPLNMVD